MSNVRQFAAVNTKIRSMIGKLLSEEDYLKMIEMNNENEIFEYLDTNTYYGNIFENLDEADYNISNVENHIQDYIFELYKKIMCFISGDYRKVFRLLIMKFEVEDIKSFIRALILKESVKNFYIDHHEYSVYSKLNYKDLSDSVDLEDFIEKLKGTVYYDILKLYLYEDPKRILFYMEMNIDRIYFLKLTNEIKKYKDDERPIFDILQMNIDFLNFQWIYRGRKFYNLSSEEILNYTLPNGHYLTYEILKKLAYSGDDEEIFEIMSKTRYKKIFEHESLVERYIERDMDRYLYKYFLKSEKESLLNMVTIVTFTHRLEFEMRDLLTIIEAKHYGIKSNELKDYLIRIL